MLLAGLALLLLLSCPAGAQVTATAELRQGIAEVRVGNPSSYPLHITIEGLFRDATTDSTPVTLGDTVHALISPAVFTLAPGTVQTVRIRVRDSVSVGELLRLATLLTPVDTASKGARIVIAQRLITKARVVTP